MRPLLVCLALTCLQAPAQIVLRIGNAPAVTITAENLAKLPRHTAVLNEHGKRIAYEGALLRDVLAQGALDFGKELRGKQLSTYISALASDGYQVVYALAELDPTLIDSGILVADKREGQPLAPNERPFRIIAPRDKRPARCLRMLQEIDVVQLRK